MSESLSYIWRKGNRGIGMGGNCLQFLAAGTMWEKSLESTGLHLVLLQVTQCGSWREKLRL